MDENRLQKGNAWEDEKYRVRNQEKEEEEAGSEESKGTKC